MNINKTFFILSVLMIGAGIDQILLICFGLYGKGTSEIMVALALIVTGALCAALFRKYMSWGVFPEPPRKIKTP